MPNKQIKNAKETCTMNHVIKAGKVSEVLAALVQEKFTKRFGELDINTLLESLIAEGKSVKNGNLESTERMLLLQANTLNTIFNSLACRAAHSEHMPHYEMHMRLAFKAQSQCRATLETLAAIKNPPHVAFVKQANIGHNQQINNNSPPISSSRARENKNQQNQLLENDHGERVDTGAASKAIHADQELAAMVKINRS